jgi:SAM-dependent methyltransferase
MKTQYSSISNDYHSHMLKYPASVKDDFISKCDLKSKEIDVLEYGCGSGIDATYFINKYSNIVNYIGIDNSEEMLQKFNSTFKNTKVKGILADIDEYIPKENTYDLVFGMYSIHYSNDLPKIMKRIYSSLKNGGYFCLRDAHPLVGFFRKRSKQYDTKEIVEFPLAGGGSGITVKHPTFTFEEYINSSTSAGFRIVSLNENIGKQGKELGLDGYIIPTTFTFILKKE